MSRFVGNRAVLGTLILLLWPAVSLSGERVALLIGNSRYDNAELTLRNPENDAAALGVRLRNLGFDVTEALNQNLDGMETALAEFRKAASGAEMALFFFAGHGVQVAGENHLIATDFNTFDESELKKTAVTMSRVREAFEAAGPDVGILVLDACRNNPFSDTGTVARGLVRTKGGAGLLIAYATDPGNVAYDGAGRNSVFTEALLKQIGTPGIEARIMFGRVRQEVVRQTRGKQIPWVEEAVLGEHYFAGINAGEDLSDIYTQELRTWRKIFNSTEIAPFEGYLQKYPDGLFSEFAKDRIAMLNQARQAGKVSGLSSGEILAQGEPVRASAALTALGFLSQQRGLGTVALTDLASAFDAYRSQLSNPEIANLDQLFSDAARISVFLAATTAQRIRTDIVALSSVEKTLEVAQDALTQIAEIAKTDAAAVPVLESAQMDANAIRRSRNEILLRLDQSRTYYDELLVGAVDFFPENISLALIGNREQSSGLVEMEQRLIRDAELFLRHVSNADEKTRGSYAWLADFLPKS